MTKLELFNTVTGAVAAFAEEAGLDADLTSKLQGIISDNLAPKSGGGSVNLDEVTKRDEDGNFTEILCATSKVWLPATLDFFYEDKSDAPKITDAEGNGLKRLSRQAESIGKKFIKENRATIQAITDDILEAEDMGQVEELKTLLVDAKAAKPDYSVVSADLPATEEA